jgi:ATP-dependent exoDNAse (exonuclease V) alpha subunit
VHVLTGCGGSGKSSVVNVIIQQHHNQGVCLMASTGQAALNLSPYADTVHSTAQFLPYSNRIKPFDVNHRHAHTLATSTVFIIDEYSMLDKTSFMTLLLRIQQAQQRDTICDVLENNLIVLVGDEAQLPPASCTTSCADKTYVGVCTLHHIASCLHVEQAVHEGRYYALNVNHRNPQFASVLNRIRNQRTNPLTQEWVDEHVNNPLLTAHPPKDAYVLCSHHVLVDQYNEDILHDLFNENILAIPPLVSERPLGCSVIYLNLSDLSVRFWKTIQTQKAKGTINGLSGTVTDIHSLSSGTPTHISVKLDTTGDVIKIPRMGPCGEIITDRYLQWSFFPFVLNYASTVHSKQGATLRTKLHLHLKECFTYGLAYVALSRNTNIEDVSIAQPFTVNDLRVIDLVSFYDAWAHARHQLECGNASETSD